MSIEDKSLEEQAEKLKKIPGNIKGEVFRAYVSYVESKEGEGKGRRVLEKMEEMGCPLDIENIKSLKNYPEHLSVIFIITAKDLFNWTDDDIFEMGYYLPRVSFIIKMLLKYLVSMEMLFEKAPTYWDKHFDFGELEAVELNTKERYAVIRVKEYRSHPVVCKFHAGYFKGVIEFCVKSGKVAVEETRCIYKGDPHHEYLISWE